MVAFAGASTEASNAADAQVITKMYLGDQIQVVATLVNGTNVVVREQRASADPALDTIHPGDRIAVSWDEAAPLLLGELTAATSSEEEA
jgi:ABC-type Fe3+/spermidine/putrescine transport system ATPase subunit